MTTFGQRTHWALPGRWHCAAPRFCLALGLMVGLLLSYTHNAHAWGSHALAAYRVFENMPEVAQAAPVKVEPLEAFLKAEEKAIETLLAGQETWLLANVPNYPARPAALAFKAQATQSDEARRKAFLMALRVAPNAKLALYYEPDAKAQVDAAFRLPHSAVNTLPAPKLERDRYVALKVGDSIAVLNVLASASYEPDFGLDINLFEDSPSLANPSEWGRIYGWGKQAFGNPAVVFSSQSPFHMGFYHEDRILYLAASFIQRTFPLVRVNQYAGLAALAHQTGHPYWAWRFTGLALHYIQDLSQPYHATVSPGSSTIGLLAINTMAMAGFPKKKDDTIVLLSNRHLVLEAYQAQLLSKGTSGNVHQALAQALGNMQADSSYPAWSPLYARDVVAKQSYASAPELARVLGSAFPHKLVNDPRFDFGANEDNVDLNAELAKMDKDQLQQLDAAIAALLANFGAHSRNTVRGILKAGAAK